MPRCEPFLLLLGAPLCYHCQPLFTCHCEPKAWQSREDQILNPKSEILNNIKWPKSKWLKRFWALSLDIGICLGFSALGLGFPCRVSLRAEGVAISEKQNPGSEIVNGAGWKATGQEMQGWSAKRGRVVAFWVVFCFFTFALWSWYFGLGILVLHEEAVGNQQSAAS